MSAYNESFDELNKSIDSIINQTYQNIEFIIVSDNPENKNIKMAVQAANDQRIKFIENKENIGFHSLYGIHYIFCCIYFKMEFQIYLQLCWDTH